ncbi:MAG: EamA family transporter [Bacteroidetes bacterium]|nr:MAG: EamA family transporter [Bacteroidota bacterium]
MFICPKLPVSKNIFVHLALFTVALAYAANYSFAKWAMPEYISPYGFILLRVGCGALFFGTYYFFFAREKIQNTRDYIDFAICAFFGVALNMLAFFKGLSMTSAINASVLMLLAPVLVVLFSAIGYKKRIKPLVYLGILIAFLGAALLVNVGSFSFDNNGLMGDLLVILNASSFAFYLYYVARLLKKYSALTVTAFIFMIGLVFVFPIGIHDFLAAQWTAMPTHVIFALSFVVLFVTILAYLLNTWALQNSSSTTAGSYIYLQPLLASIIAVSLGMDHLTWGKVSCGLLIVLGLWLVNRGR